MMNKLGLSCANLSSVEARYSFFINHVAYAEADYYPLLCLISYFQLSSIGPVRNHLPIARARKQPITKEICYFVYAIGSF